MTFNEFMYLIRSDLYRYEGIVSPMVFLRHYVRSPGFRYTFFMRLCTYLTSRPLLRYGVRHFFSFILNRISVRYGIDLPYTMQIGPGLYIGHYGCIVINGGSTIGRNCNLSHDVTIGQTNRGIRRGCPSIGNNVYIAPGAKIIGRIVIGNNVAIGANAVVTKDVPDNAVVAGVPGQVVSMNGSAGYINRTDYD